MDATVGESESDAPEQQRPAVTLAKFKAAETVVPLADGSVAVVDTRNAVQIVAMRPKRQPESPGMLLLQAPGESDADGAFLRLGAGLKQRRSTGLLDIEGMPSDDEFDTLGSSTVDGA